MSFLIIFVFLQPSLAENSCLSWMISAGVYPQSENCEAKCSVIPTGMGNFSCPSTCDDLCKTKYLSDDLNKSVFGAIGYTADEVSFAIKNPIEMNQARKLADKALASTLKIFKVNNRNDESDAFRHFIWSGLMTNKLGAETANKILNAHENNPDQSKRDQEMDIFNNSQGIKAAIKLIKNKKFSMGNIEKEALSQLEKNNLKIINKTGVVPKWRE